MSDRLASRRGAPGRLKGSGPVAVIDIGSNSVRLVIYERLARSPTLLFNEKVFAGLGRGLPRTGRLSEESIARALVALSRFRRLSEHAGVGAMQIIATAAVREAENGADFIDRVESVLGRKVRTLSGADEAKLAAHGVACGVWRADGMVGDLGGGSLELVSVSPAAVGIGTTLPLGVLRLQEQSGGSVRKARRMASSTLAEAGPVLKTGAPTLYLIGGTWRALARLHMVRSKAPLHVMHQYRMPTKAALRFCDELLEGDVEALGGIERISRQRRGLLPYGAAVLSELIRVVQPAALELSALGVREGLLYDMLDHRVRRQDPLIAGASELGYLRSRSPAHTEELIVWTRSMLGALGVEETALQSRLRQAACLLSDIDWRGHPDYRGEQSFNSIVFADLVGINHPQRAFVSSCVFFRHVGADEEALNPIVRRLIEPSDIHRAKLLGVAFRVAYLISAAMPGFLTKTRFERADQALVLVIPPSLADLDGERLRKRLGQLARLLELEDAEVVIR